MRVLVCFLLFQFCLVFQATAHGDLHERINYVSREIQMFPDSASLYVKRGKLYLQHHQYNKSLADLKRSELLRYSSFEQKYILTQVYHKIGDIHKAKVVCNELLRHEQHNVRLLNLKAQLYYDNEEYTLSAQTFEKVIDFSNRTFPQNYLNAARAWKKSNSKLSHKNAVKILKEGLVTLGELIVLNKELIQLYLHEKNYNAAITIQLRVIEQSNRKEAAYYDLSKLYLQKGANKDAIKYLDKARESLCNLPMRIQNTKAMKALLLKIDQDLITLEKE